VHCLQLHHNHIREEVITDSDSQAPMSAPIVITKEMDAAPVKRKIAYAKSPQKISENSDNLKHIAAESNTLSSNLVLSQRPAATVG